MTSAAAIAAVGSAESRKLVTHEMFTARSAVAAPAKDAYLIYEIAFFQNVILTAVQIYQ
jgi:hypothetical protein